MRKSIKRVIAGVLSAVLSLSLVNFSALSMSLASELSGYEIGVEYSEDNTSATLIGEVSGVKEGVQLDKLVDSQGQELDPISFSQTVEENGTYHFTLYYQEKVETQDADQPTTEEKTQELEVVVDGIGKEKADQPQQPEVQEGIVMGTEDAKDAPSPFVEKVESMTAAPKTVPLDLLQRNMAQARASKWIEIRADEADYKLQSVEFGGGPLVAGAPGLPSIDGRTFVKADFIDDETGVTRVINGLYSYNDKWYYTVDGTTVDGGGAGTLYVGFELPSNTTVRLFYQITNQDKHRLDAYGSNADLANEFKMYLNGNQAYTWLLYAQGTKIVLEFVMPVTLRDLNIEITNVGTFNIGSAQWLGDGTLTENQIWQTSDQKYTLAFTMPAQDVSINFNGVQWTNADKRNFAIGSDFTPDEGESYNTTSWQDNPTIWGSFFESIPYDKYNSPGILTNAYVSHTTGGMNYTWESTFQVYNQGGSSAKPMQFAQGDFKSNQMVGFKLRMDRKGTDERGEYTYKPNALVMNVYIGESYDWSNTKFHQYSIQLAHTSGLTKDSTRDTYLDCGARVRTICYEWDEDAYYYRIYVYNMTHNFTLYDRPARTNQESFLLSTGELDENDDPIPALQGIQLVNYGESNLSGSTASDVNSPYSGAPIRPDSDFQTSWVAGAGNNPEALYHKYFFIRPKYGYTAPSHDIKNRLSNTWLLSIGQVSGMPGTYQYTLQIKGSDRSWATRTPTLIDFTAKPITFNVGYYRGEEAWSEQYYSAVQMTATQNANYPIEEIKDSNAGTQKLKGYRVKVQVNYYDNNQTLTDDLRIPPPSDPNNPDALWYPNRDVLSFSHVYDYLLNQGKNTINESVSLRIIPVYASGSEAAVQAQYEIVEQTAFAKIDNNSADRNLTTEASNPQDINATSTKKNINAYVGSTVSLYGNKEWYRDEATGKYYLYNEKASRPSGQVTVENPVAASLEYLLATKVTVDVGTLGTGNNGESWNQSQLNNLYTSVNNFNHQFNLGDLKYGTLEGQDFVDWGIRKSDGTVVRITEGMKYQGNLNFYNLGTVDGDLWSDIFNSGTCTLVAMWKSDIPVVTSDDGSITNKDASIVIKHNSNETYEVVGTFKYGTETVTQDDLDQAFSSNKLKIALLFKDPQIPGQEAKQWATRYENDQQGAYFGEPTITHMSGSTFTVTFTSSKGTADSWTDGGNFRIFAWTESNSGGGSLNAEAIAQALNGANGTNPYEGAVPSVNVFTKKVYPVDTKSPGEETVNADVTQDSVQLTTTFHYGYDQNRYPDNSFTEDMLSGLINDSTIKVKLERKTTENGDWTEVNQSGLITAGANGTITFNYTLGNNLLDYNNNQFRVKVWTSANGNTEDNYPSYIFKVQINVDRVTLGNDTLTNENADNITILHAVTSQEYEVVGTFKYGNGTITQEQLDKLFTNGTLQIGLFFKDPQIPNVNAPTWQKRYQNGQVDPFFGGPTIQKTGDTFTVTFTSSQGIDARWMDGGNFRIFAWTISNPEAGSLTVDDIQNQLNGAQEGTNPFEGKIPSVNVLTEKVYQISAQGETEKTVTAKATQGSVVLDATFHYDFDTSRYPDASFTQTMLENLIADDTIQVKLEKKGSTGDWSPVDGAKAFLTAGEDGTGTISFNYTLSGENLFEYDNNQFRITVWTDVNTEPLPSYTFTVKINAEKVTLADDSVTNQSADDFTILDGVTTEFSIVGTFKYGNGTATQQDIINAFDSDKLKIALMIKDPQIPGGSQKNWEIRYKKDSVATFGDPIIEKADGNDTFTVTFKVNETSHKISGAWSDGANFRVFAWTEENQDGATITPEYIAEQLNGAVGEANPLENKVPSMNLLTKKVYQISTEGEEQEIVNAEATDDSVQLNATFRYAYDAERYPTNSFTREMLQQLITEDTIRVTVERKTAETEAWTPVENQTSLVTAGDNGTISFSYTLDSNLYSYNNNQFRITVWTAANGDTHPSHTFTVSVSVEPIKNEGGVPGPVKEKPVEGNVGGGLALEAKFQYGDGTATLEQIKALIDEGVIKIALLKIDPDLEIEGYPVNWRNVPYDGSSNAIPKPQITQEEGSTDFTVTFEQVSQSLNGTYDDGARFRMYVWTDANAANPDGTSISITQIADDLNSVEEGAQPVITELPWVHYNLSLLYKVANNGDDTSKVLSVLSTASSIELSGTFKYDYDGTRYWKGFSAETLKTLIDGNKFSSKIEYQKEGETGWTPLPDAQITLTAAESGGGIINFSYTFTDANGALAEYDGAKFKVTLWTAANGAVETEYPVYTITVAYIADPSAYVNIPKYIILEDDKSNVMVDGQKQDGYAGKSAQVTYNTNAGTQVKPEVTVKVQDGVKLHQGSHDGPVMQNMGIGIYSDTGVKIPAGEDGYSSIGTLSQENNSIMFWMNTPRGTVKNEQYYATVMFMMELAGTIT